MTTVSQEYVLEQILNNVTTNSTYNPEPFVYNWYDWTSLGVSLIFAIIITLTLMFYYSYKRRYAYGVYITLFVTLFMLFYMSFMLTVDIAAGLNLCGERKHDLGFTNCAGMIPLHMVIIYNIMYWAIQVLSWIFIPYLQSYVKTGQIGYIRKIWGGFVDNFISYLIYFSIIGGGAVCLIAYILILNIFSAKNYPVTFSSILGLGMSISNAYGIVLLSILVGHSVASIPKTLWFQGDNVKMLQKNYFSAVKMSEDLDESKETLESYISEFFKIERDIDQFPDIEQDFETMKKEIEPLFQPYLKKTLKKKKGDLSFQLNYKTLATYYQNFLDTLRKTKALENQWKYLQDETIFLEDVEKSAIDTTIQVTSPLFRDSNPNPFFKVIFTIEYYYHVYVKYFLFKILACFSVLFSLSLIWSQLTPIWVYITPDYGKYFSIFYLISRGLELTPFNRISIQIFTGITLALIMYYCYFSLFQLKLPSYMTIVPHNTDDSSFLFLLILLCRIGPTICFNYLNLLGLRAEDGIAFSKVMGTLSTENLKLFGTIGNLFSTFFPLVIPVIAVAVLFDLDRRFLTIINVRTFVLFPIFSNSIQNSEIEEGKRLISYERKKRESQMNGDDILNENGDQWDKYEKKGRSRFAQKMREREKQKKQNQPEEIPLEKLLGGDIIIDLD
eukprot:gene1555-12681_t